MIRYFSMFSGIGGFEYGIQQSNIEMECVGFSEIDKYAKSIYKRNFPDHINYGDATEIRTEELPDFDLLVGGFPCQAFSVAGKRRGFDDTRGTLFFEIARILKDKRPRYFLLENVRGLLSHNKGKTFQTILEVLSDLGYHVQWEVLNSKDFGVPQNRERIFIKGYSRRECGREVLSFRRNHGKVVEEIDNRKVSNTYYGVRNGRVHKPDEIMNCLATQGHNGGGSQIIIEDVDPKERKLIRLNNNEYHPQGERLYSHNGLSVTLNASGNNDFYTVDDETENQIKNDTRKIKKVGNFSESNHHGKNVYSTDGLCPTLCSGSVVKNGLNILDKDPSELSETEKNILNNFSEVDDNRMMTTTKEGNSLCVTTSRPTRPVNKKLTNYVLENNSSEIEEEKQEDYVIEECIGSTQKHASRTDGTYSPALTCAMGQGRGHIPMIKTKKNIGDSDKRKLIKIGNCSSNGKHWRGDVFSSDGICRTLTVCDYKDPIKIGEPLKLKESTEKGYVEAYPNDGIEIGRSGCSIRRGVCHEKSVGTLNTGGGWGTVTSDYRIRKLTPKECERLQGFPDDWTKYGKDDELISNTQRYKCCGNAVTTNVITAIVDEMFDKDEGE